MRRLLRVAVALAVLATGALTGAASQPPRSPQRIVSLVPALTELLFAIGAGPQVVGVSSYDHEPPEVESRAKVGALLDPDTERILALRPDLVAIYGSQTDLRVQLQRAAIPIFDYRHAGLADIFTTTRALGTATGHTAEADALVRRLEQRIAAVRTRTGRGPRVRTLLVFGREAGSLRNIYVSGGRGFLHDMLVAAGGENVMADVAQESVQASTELILTRAPDVILELRDRGALPEGRLQALAGDWSRLASVPAVRQKRVHIVSGTGLTVPGPRVAAAIERLASVLHPDRMAP
jgi:iron complex transport system substrate-binding protein